MLAAPADLALRLGVAADDAALLLALRRASSRFEGEVGYSLTSPEAPVTVYLSGDGGRTLLLPSRPVIGTPVITIDGVSVTDWQVGRAAGILQRAGGWPRGLDNVQVTYRSGFEKVPGDVEDAVLEQAEATYWVLPGVAAHASGSESRSYLASAGGVTQRWADTVARYSIRGDEA